MKELHKPYNVFLLTFLFGPLAGALTTGLDYKRNKVKRWILIMVLPVIISLCAAIILGLISSNVLTSGFIFPFFIGLTYYFYQKQLEIKINEPLVYKRFMNTLIYSLIGLVLFVAISIPLGILTDFIF